ncbi:MAG: DeoR/GlpR transcriptional regulator [Anaerolineae bacterium]|nr:DeoR/GlpR transcriptional regulator [Anaerolineae bacterium]
MKREKRFRLILALLDEQGRVNVDDLAIHFNVSAETIRRDLSTMSEQGLLRKVYGGAVKFQSAQENSFTLRTQQYAEQKTSIAQYAVRFVNAGDSLFLNSGTTTTIFARELAKRIDNLFVITNSPQIAHEFWNDGQTNHKIYLLGGYYNGAEVEILGTSVITAIQQFRTDHVFLTVGAVNASQGFMDYRIETAEMNRMMVQQARRTTVLIDSSKLDQTALVSAFALDAVDRVITDIPLSDALANAFNKADIQVHVAENSA